MPAKNDDQKMQLPPILFQWGNVTSDFNMKIVNSFIDNES